MTFLSYAQNYEDVLLWRALHDQHEGFFIDVGAWDPCNDSVTKAFSDRGWRGINIEPVPGCHARLVQARSRDINLQVAIGAEPGVSVFHEVLDTGLSTLDAEIADAHAETGLEVRTYSVNVITLTEVCRRYAPDAIHFLKLDCEGGERDALLGMDFSRFRPWIILVEATAPRTPRLVHQGWEDIILAGGYGFAWFDGLNRFYVANEHFERFAPLLALPPNVFDEFQRADSIAAIVVAPPPAIDPFISAVPMLLSDAARIELTRSCRDCDHIAKVSDAGQVRTEPDGTRVQIMHNGLKVLADGYYGDWMTRLIEACHGHREPQKECAFAPLMPLLPADATMIELGGYWAYYSASFLQGAPGRRAVILEPDPLHRAVGERNLQLNGLKGSFVSGFAGSEPADPSLFHTEKSGDLWLRRYDVPQLMEQSGLATVDLLHCDTRGAELSVLEGCRALFAAERIRWVFVSTHAHQISGDPLTHERCLKLLRELGAAIEVEHNAYESFSGDGLIVARFGAPDAGFQPVCISHARQSESLFRAPVYDLAAAQPVTRFGAAAARALIEASYQAFLARAPRPFEIEAQQTALADGDMVAFLNRFLIAPEYLARALGNPAEPDSMPISVSDSSSATAKAGARRRGSKQSKLSGLVSTGTLV